MCFETEEYQEEVCGSTAMQNNDECQFSKESGYSKSSARQLKML
jgi:hypothetical protein